MKKIIQIIFFLFATTGLLAQNDVVFGRSKKYPWKGNNQFLLDYIKKYDLQDSVYYRIPVTFWIYSTNKGYFGATPSEIKQQITLLNYYFNTLNKTGIEFYVADVIDIRKTRHKKLGYTFESTLVSLSHRHNGTINVHLVDKLTLNIIAEKINFGGTYNSLTNSIIISRNNLPTGLAHETGHFFCLEHPHKNWDKGKRKAESVSRTMLVNKKDSIRNCEARADCFCDTPAEPDLSDLLDDSCHYIGNLTDPWGEPYKPNTHNIMSYQRNKKCRTHFTQMQIAAMLYCASQNKYSYGWRNTPENISFTFDSYEPDDNWSTGTWLYENQKQYHTFHLIFEGKKPPEVNKNDVFKLRQDKQKSNYIVFEKGNYAFPEMTMEIHDAFMKKIFEIRITDPTTIKLPVTDSDIYYIVLRIENNYASGELFDYRITYQTL